MIRIVVADDHGLIRRGIAQLLSDCEDMAVVGEAATGEAALELVLKGGCDIVILDLLMPGRGGLDIIRDIREASPGTRIIVLSICSEEHYAVRSLRDGASAYLTKAMAEGELVEAIHRVASGRRYITAEVAERLASYIEFDSELPPHERLSRREFQVLCLLGAGRTVSEAALDLGLSPKTVGTYRARLLEKMGMRTNAQLIKYAVDHRLAR